MLQSNHSEESWLRKYYHRILSRSQSQVRWLKKQVDSPRRKEDLERSQQFRFDTTRSCCQDEFFVRDNNCLRGKLPPTLSLTLQPSDKECSWAGLKAVSRFSSKPCCPTS